MQLDQKEKQRAGRREEHTQGGGGEGGGGIETSNGDVKSSTQGHAEWRRGRVAEGVMMFPFRAASDPNCLIGGCVRDRGGSSVLVSPSADCYEARSAPGRPPVLAIGFPCLISNKLCKDIEE